MLDPFECLVLDSGHAVNVQCNNEVNAAIERLFEKVQKENKVEMKVKSKL